MKHLDKLTPLERAELDVEILEEALRDLLNLTYELAKGGPAMPWLERFEMILSRNDAPILPWEQLHGQ